MKRIILFILLYFSAVSAFSQKINGQWRGYFDSNGDIVQGNFDNTEYVLEVEINGTTVSGFSYSYFQGRKYYVICKLEGTYFPKTKGIRVTETARIKGNTPPDFQDCLQVHYLTYQKEGKLEKLAGRWMPAPGQRGGCGEGTTTLTRRTLDKNLSAFNKQSAQQPAVKKASPKTNNTTAKAKTVAPKKAVPPTITAKAKPSPAPVIARAETTQKEPAKIAVPEIKKPTLPEVKADINFEKRKADVLKTIQIENETFKVDLYDNGEVDGDSISLFYNSKLILSHKRLSEKAITLTLDATTGAAMNELTMYAENLGEIPPNTALMVITDGEKRYEVRISSDLKNSGTIRFIHKPDTPQ